MAPLAFAFTFTSPRAHSSPELDVTWSKQRVLRPKLVSKRATRSLNDDAECAERIGGQFVLLQLTPPSVRGVARPPSQSPSPKNVAAPDHSPYALGLSFSSFVCSRNSIAKLDFAFVSLLARLVDTCLISFRLNWLNASLFLQTSQSFKVLLYFQFFHLLSSSTMLHFCRLPCFSFFSSAFVLHISLGTDRSFPFVLVRRPSTDVSWSLFAAGPIIWQDVLRARASSDMTMRMSEKEGGRAAKVAHPVSRLNRTNTSRFWPDDPKSSFELVVVVSEIESSWKPNYSHSLSLEKRRPRHFAWYKPKSKRTRF